MIVVTSCIDSTVVSVVWLSDSAMARRAVEEEGEGATEGASAEPEPEPRANTQHNRAKGQEQYKERRASTNKEQSTNNHDIMHH